MNYCVTHHQFYVSYCVYCGPPSLGSNSQTATGTVYTGGWMCVCSRPNPNTACICANCGGKVSR